MKLKRIIAVIITATLAIGVTACAESVGDNDNETTLLYQGHASLRITAKDGTVIYVDPAAGAGYDVPADIIFVTHGHSDHNKIDRVTQKDDCIIITSADAINGDEYSTFSIKGIEAEAVEAYNANHSKATSVGNSKLT